MDFCLQHTIHRYFSGQIATQPDFFVCFCFFLVPSAITITLSPKLLMELCDKDN